MFLEGTLEKYPERGTEVSVSLDSSPTISLDFSDRLWVPKTMPGQCGELQRGFTKYLLSLSFYAHLHQIPITKKGSEIKLSLLVYLSVPPYILGLRATGEGNKYWRCLGDCMPSDSTCVDLLSLGACDLQLLFSS